MNIQALIKKYSTSQLTIGVLGSHSALDVCSGAKKQGFKTLVVTQKGREKTYSEYYKTKGDEGCVDKTMELNNFKDILSTTNQKLLTDSNTVFIPHRSFEVYINDYNAIEKNFEVPIFGNRYLLKAEERGVKPNQYDLLEEAKIRYPKQFKNPKDIDRLCIVKVLEKERGFERAFFLTSSPEEFKNISQKLIKEGKITKEALEKSVIEEFVLGVHVNFNFFYSPLHNRLELIGTDTRRQTNLEGLLRLPATHQNEVLKKIETSYEEAGHTAVTVLESMLERAFEIGERFVKATQKLYKPGIIGPFALQSIITAGPPKKDIVVIDVSPRMPGSPGISATPYSSYLFGKPITVGERIAMEVKEAANSNKLDKIIT